MLRNSQPQMITKKSNSLPVSRNNSQRLINTISPSQLENELNELVSPRFSSIARANSDIATLLKETTTHPILIDSLEYINFLTRLGVTITTEIEMWLSENQNLYFLSVNQAVHYFTKALVFGDFELMKYVYASARVGDFKDFDVYTPFSCNRIWDKIVFNISVYVNYLKVMQWDTLKYWILESDEEGLLSVMWHVREIIRNEKEELESFQKNQRMLSLNKMLEPVCD